MKSRTILPPPRVPALAIARGAAVVLVAALAAGCAGVPARELPPTPDRIERVNRGIDGFNRKVDRHFLRPIARGYEKVLPRVVRKGIGNFFDNLGEPVNFVGNMLQGKFAAAGKDVGRFLFNSTAGIGGLFDLATPAGMPRSDEDFGQTFAVWGIPSGPYLVLPFFGPTTLRDGFGDVLDIPADLLYSIEERSVRDKLVALDVIDTRTRFLGADDAYYDALDPYVFLRESYLQHRTYVIYDGDPPLEDFPEDELEDEEGWELDVKPEAPPPGQ
jgi:phospholipid-binding lipoprotein MlaA